MAGKFFLFCNQYTRVCLFLNIESLDINDSIFHVITVCILVTIANTTHERNKFRTSEIKAMTQ